MYARNDIKKLFDDRLNARLALAGARSRAAAWVDLAVARWLARCAGRIEAAQGLFETDRPPARGLRAGGLWSMPASAR